jgi:NAD(P)-dependent dehydrogenase (short-subunit alcohol dehydrogenase family)
MSGVQGKVALLTGAGSGIGAATATQLIARGARVVLVDIDRDLLAGMVERLGEESVLSVTADVTELSDMESAVARAVERFGGLDIVVANAGIGSYGSVLAVDPEIFRRVIDVNLIGAFHTVRAALPQLLQSGGYILIVSSEAAYVPVPGGTAYAASKAGVEHFANSLRFELGYRGVAVGSTHMSWIDTPLLQDIKRDLSSFRERLAQLPGPLREEHSAEVCAEAFVRGIERRASRVNVPRWVELLRWLKPALSSRMAEAGARRTTGEGLPRTDEEVARLGRSASARVTVPASARVTAPADRDAATAEAAGSRPGPEGS